MICDRQISSAREGGHSARIACAVAQVRRFAQAVCHSIADDPRQRFDLFDHSNFSLLCRHVIHFNFHNEYVESALGDDDASVRLAAAAALAALVSGLPIARIDPLFEQLTAAFERFDDVATLSALRALLSAPDAATKATPASLALVRDALLARALAIANAAGDSFEDSAAIAEYGATLAVALRIASDADRAAARAKLASLAANNDAIKHVVAKLALAEKK